MQKTVRAKGEEKGRNRLTNGSVQGDFRGLLGRTKVGKGRKNFKVNR